MKFINRFRLLFITHEEKERLTLDPCLSIGLLEVLADDKDWWVRYRVARNPNCSIRLLEKLAGDKNFIVRSCVARNPNCPEHIKNYLEVRNCMENYYA